MGLPSSNRSSTNLDAQSTESTGGSSFQVKIKPIYNRRAPVFKCKSTSFSQNKNSVLAADCTSGKILEFCILEQPVIRATTVYEENNSHIFKICHVTNLYLECLAIVFFENSSEARYTSTSFPKVRLIRRSSDIFSSIEGSIVTLPERTPYRRY